MSLLFPWNVTPCGLIKMLIFSHGIPSYKEENEILTITRTIRALDSCSAILCFKSLRSQCIQKAKHLSSVVMRISNFQVKGKVHPATGQGGASGSG